MPETIQTNFGTNCPEVEITEGYILLVQTKFEREVKFVPFGKGIIRVENLTPVLSPKDRERRKREIEIRLFNVFSKYEDKKRK